MLKDEKKIRQILGRGDLQKLINYSAVLLDRVLKNPLELKEGLSWEEGELDDGTPYQYCYLEKIVFCDYDINYGVDRLYIDKLQQMYPDWKGKSFIGEEESQKGIEELDGVVRLIIEDINYIIGYHEKPPHSNIFFSEAFEDGEYWVLIVVPKYVLEKKLGFMRPVYWNVLLNNATDNK